MSSLAREHDLLLRAALLRGSEAIDAWDRWRACTNVDALDPDSQWLLPLLDHNLRTLGVPGDRLVRYHNVYRHNWYKNQLLLKQAEPGLQLDQPALLLGGAAMALAHYDAIGSRPFCSVEVLRASLFGEDEDEAARRRAVPVAWRTLRVLTLDPADQLLDLCLRREEWDRRSRLFWIADVVTLLQRHHDLEWTRVTDRAQRIGRTAAVSSARTFIDAWSHTGIAA